ncbi:MAG: peptide-methionine (S)-S-oxide reductase MsrA [Gammaproteobacteria bacterium]
MKYTILSSLLLLFSSAVFSASDKTESAVLGGGCYWCIEADFEKLEGVTEVISGFSGGHTLDPTYKQVSAGGTGHIEVVKVIYDPKIVSYTEILDFFWRHIDPTRDDGQFCDTGPSYRPAIFYTDDQKELAFSSKENIEKVKPFAAPIKVEMIEASQFYAAEEYHQDYYKKNPLRYRYYRHGCGRDKRVEQLWGTSDH